MFGSISFSAQILILSITPLLFISDSILCEFAMLPDVYILLSPQEEGSTHLEAHLSKKLRALSVIILVCLGNT